MTKEEVQAQLLEGKTLSDLFEFSESQCGTIYKAEKFTVSDDVIYVPDLNLIGIPLEKRLTEKQVPYVLMYSGNDFLLECNGNKWSAEELFYWCDWLTPHTTKPHVIECRMDMAEYLRNQAYKEVCIEKADDGKVDRIIDGIINGKIRKDNLFDKVMNLTKRVRSDHAIKRWQIITEWFADEDWF